MPIKVIKSNLPTGPPEVCFGSFPATHSSAPSSASGSALQDNELGMPGWQWDGVTVGSGF